MPLQWRIENMHVIWHDAPRELGISLLMKVWNCFKHHLPHPRNLQVAFADALIEICFNAFRIQFCQPLLFLPRQITMQLLCRLQYFPSLTHIRLEYLLWQRIGQAKGYCVARTWCFPMGQIAPRANGVGNLVHDESVYEVRGRCNVGSAYRDPRIG